MEGSGSVLITDPGGPKTCGTGTPINITGSITKLPNKKRWEGLNKTPF